VLAPAVDDPEDHVALDLARHLRRERFLAPAYVSSASPTNFDQRLTALDVDLLAELLDRDVGAVERVHLGDEACEVPFVGGSAS
jgi:hypothetical protein